MAPNPAFDAPGKRSTRGRSVQPCARRDLPPRGKLWLYGGAAGGWHFVTLPQRQAAEIRGLFAGPGRRGWGSLRVKATIGATTWATSIFPEKGSGSYLLPVKAAVRKAEGVQAGDTVAFTLEVEG